MLELLWVCVMVGVWLGCCVVCCRYTTGLGLPLSRALAKSGVWGGLPVMWYATCARTCGARLRAGVCWLVVELLGWLVGS